MTAVCGRARTVFDSALIDVVYISDMLMFLRYPYTPPEESLHEELNIGFVNRLPFLMRRGDWVRGHHALGAGPGEFQGESETHGRYTTVGG